VLRKRWLSRSLTEQRFSTAVAHLQQQLGFERVPTLRLVSRAFDLRANVSAYDACYVAPAEHLDCELITADGRWPARPARCAPSASCADGTCRAGASASRSEQDSARARRADALRLAPATNGRLRLPAEPPWRGSRSAM